jgi:predicted RNase H-like nuclease (RuvC/YqgF family)
LTEISKLDEDNSRFKSCSEELTLEIIDLKKQISTFDNEQTTFKNKYEKKFEKQKEHKSQKTR